MVGIEPALSDHALRREVHDVGRALAFDQAAELVEVAVQIDLREPDTLRLVAPFVGKKCLVRLGRAARGEDVVALFREMRGEACAGERVRPQDEECLAFGHQAGGSGLARGMVAQPR